MTCANNPPPPDGFKIWRGSPPPRPLVQWAVDLRDHWMPKVNFGETTGIDFVDPTTGQSQYVVARKDHHTWTYKNGQLVSGICIPGITLYQSKLTPALAGAPGMGDASTSTATPDTLDTPDPTVAAYAQEPDTNWGLVAVSAGAAAAVVVAFWAGIHFAGKAQEHARRAA